MANAKVIEERQHVKSKHLTNEDRESLYKCLLRSLNLTDTAKYLKCDVSTVKKEIDRNKILKINARYKNACGRKNNCTKMNVCGNSKCSHKCSTCIKTGCNCNKYCSDYTLEPKCKKLKHLCGVCNGCDDLKDCSLNKYIYSNIEAQKKHDLNLVEAHKGVRLDEDELKRFSEFLKPFIDHNMSLEAIKGQCKDDFPYSIQTVYNWIDLGLLPGIDNVKLPRKVRYSTRKAKYKAPCNNKDYLIGRYYEDFLKDLTENPLEEVVEMDTVEGCNHSSFIMTLLFRKTNFMLAFKLKDHTADSIIEVFDYIKSELGAEIFKKSFPKILTDRGSEFSNPLDIEIDLETGEKLTSVYFCDSRQSQQKGKIEKNHEELRKICPKGFDFNTISQDKLNLALNHINNYPRKLLNYKSPYELFSLLASPQLLELNKSKKIGFKDVTLRPSIIK